MTSIIFKVANNLAGKIGDKYFNDYFKEDIDEHGKNVANILKKLNTEFESKKPEWGPVFERPSFKKAFVESLTKKVYHLYYGPSGSGKSIAISNALHGKTGVIYLSVRNSVDIASIWLNIGIASGFIEPKAQTKDVQPVELIRSLKDAGKKWKAETGQKMIFVIEDLHSPHLQADAFQICGPLVELYDAGLANVIFTISDYSSLERFLKQSGHSSRLKYSLFPDMNDKELKEQLIDKFKVRYPKSIGSVMGGGQIKEEEKEINLNEISVDLVVEKIGSHMEDLTLILKESFEKQQSVEPLVDQIVKQRAQQLYTFFGSLKDLGQVFVGHNIFEKLLASKGEPVKWGDIYLSNRDHLEMSFVAECINHLVAQNFLTFVDAEYVKAHSRATLAVYKVAKQKEDLVSKFQEAEIDVKARDRKKKH